MALLVKKFGRFMKKSHHSNSNSFSSYNNNDSKPSSSNKNCYNCDRPGHFAADCRKPKRDDRKSNNNNNNNNKNDNRRDQRSSRKSKEQKALLAVDCKRAWADSDSDSSSGSESEEEITCLMANDFDEEVFDFGSEEFSKEELVTALHDMVEEYKKLSDSLNELKLQKSSDNKIEQPTEDVALLTKVTELTTEVERLKSTAQLANEENKRLSYVISAWTKSSADLKRLHSMQRPAGCKHGLGYIEDSKDKSRSKQKPQDKLKPISFVKEGSADSKTDNTTNGTTAEEGAEAPTLTYVQPTDKQSSWLKPKRRRSNKSSRKTVPKASRRPRNGNKQTTGSLPSQPKQATSRPSQTKRFSKNGKKSAGRPAGGTQKSLSLIASNGKTIRVIQVWVPKGIINLGPN